MKEKSAVGAGEGGRVTVSALFTSVNVPSTMTISPSLMPPPLPLPPVLAPRLRDSVLAPLSTAPSNLLILGGRGIGAGMLNVRVPFLPLATPLAVGMRKGYASVSEAERACFVGNFGRTGVRLESVRRPKDVLMKGLGVEGPGEGELGLSAMGVEEEVVVE